MEEDRDRLIEVGRKAVLDFLKGAAPDLPVLDGLDATKEKSGRRWFAIREAKGSSNEPILVGVDEGALVALGEVKDEDDRAAALVAAGLGRRIGEDLSERVPRGIKDTLIISFETGRLVVRA